MSWRGTSLLAAVVAVLAVVVVRDTTPNREAGVSLSVSEAPPPTKTIVPGRPLLDFDRSQIDKIVFTSGSLRYEVESSNRSASAMVDDLSGLHTLDEITAPGSGLAEYGLQPPHGTLAFQLKGIAAPVILQIGDHNPSTTSAYVRLGDSGPVYIVGALVRWKFDIALKQIATAEGDAR